MEIRFQLNTSEIRLDVITSKSQARGNSAPQKTKKKILYGNISSITPCLSDFQVAKTEFLFPPLMTKRSKSNLAQWGAK